MSVAASLENIRIRFGEPETTSHADDTGLLLNLASRHLSGPMDVALLECEGAQQELCEHFSLLKNKDRTVGMAVIECDAPGIESAAKTLYNELLAETADMNLYRLWNFLPQINDESSGQENYRLFNLGRGKAFARVYGEAEMDQHLPAATAVGLQEERHRMAVVFLAGRHPVQYFENPRQTPAYQYPAQFGPCSPSFARGAVVNDENGRVAYLAGTSSICGYETVGSGDLDKQFSETIENIGEALKQMGFDGWPDSVADYCAQFRVYVRDVADYAGIRERFAGVVGEKIAEQTVFIRADICRRPLKLEIEGVFRG